MKKTIIIIAVILILIVIAFEITRVIGNSNIKGLQTYDCSCGGGPFGLPFGYLCLGFSTSYISLDGGAVTGDCFSEINIKIFILDILLWVIFLGAIVLLVKQFFKTRGMK